MIAIEMMARKLEDGWDRMRAATYAYRVTAFPMLTGTLITVAGFLPVGLAKSSAGEYTVAIFQVVGISLILSWLGAVVFTPYLGYLILKVKVNTAQTSHDHFATPFYNRLRHWVDYCLEHRKTIIIATIALFGVGVMTLTKVPQQFFPLSNRPELIVDLWLPEGAPSRKLKPLPNGWKLFSPKIKNSELCDLYRRRHSTVFLAHCSTTDQYQSG